MKQAPFFKKPNSKVTVILALTLMLAFVAASLIVIRHRQGSIKGQAIENPQIVAKESIPTLADTTQSASPVIKVAEWGIQLSLPADMSDAYYVVSKSTYDPKTHEPNTIWLGLTSLTIYYSEISISPKKTRPI